MAFKPGVLWRGHSDSVCAGDSSSQPPCLYLGVCSINILNEDLLEAINSVMTSARPSNIRHAMFVPRAVSHCPSPILEAVSELLGKGIFCEEVLIIVTVGSPSRCCLSSNHEEIC